MGKLTRNASSSSFTPCPEGQFRAVLADVIDLGWKDQTFEGKSTGMFPFIKFVWLVDELNEDGKPFMVRDRDLKLSDHAKSNLYKRMAAWLGAKATEKMFDDGDDIDTLIGRNAFISVVHNEGTNGGTFANISTIMPLPRGMEPMPVPPDYERMCDRDNWENWVDGREPKRPEHSAFGPRPAKDDEMEAEAPVKVPQKPAPPIAKAVVAPVGEARPMSVKQSREIFDMAGKLFPDNRDAGLEQFVFEQFKGDVAFDDLNSDQAAQLIDALRREKPKVLVAAGVDGDDLDNVFADE